MESRAARSRVFEPHHFGSARVRHLLFRLWRREQLQRHLLCLERQPGKVLWDKSVSAERPEDSYTGNLREHGYASNTPVTDGEHVFVFFGKTGVVAFDLDGQQIWKVNVGRQSSNRRWGSGASLILYRDMVIVNAAEESRSVLALNKLTGKEVWKTTVDSLELSFVTPALVECESGRTDTAVAVPDELWGMNPDTGKLRWFAQTGIAGNVSPSVVAADGRRQETTLNPVKIQNIMKTRVIILALVLGEHGVTRPAILARDHMTTTLRSNPRGDGTRLATCAA